MKKILTIGANITKFFALVLVVFASLIFLVDAAARYSGSLRAQATAAVYEQIDPNFAHNGDGVPATSFSIATPFFIKEHFRRLQSCHSTVSSTFLNVENNTVYRGDTYVTWIKSGEYEFSEHVQIPPGLIAGKYRLIKKTVSFCGGDTIYYTNNHDLTIDLH